MKKSLIFAFSFIGQIGISVAVPLVALAFLGRYLDQKFGTSPYLMLAGLVIATVIVYFTLREIVRRATKEFNELNSSNNKKQNSKNK
ncbi:MAG: AtpZ/AtpI family protein [Patescibacteria group bacterium]